MPTWLGTPEESRRPVTGEAGIVSTTDDLARFFQALFGGKLLRPDLLSEMTRTVDAGGVGAGLGLFRFRLACGVAWGHGGIGAVYATMALAARDGSRAAVVAENEPDFPAVEAVADKIYCS
jgi:D-alanyl-D-alanine carboxypeptidase